MQFLPRRALVSNIYRLLRGIEEVLELAKKDWWTFFFFITPLLLYKDMDYKTRIAVFNSSKNCAAV